MKYVSSFQPFKTASAFIRNTDSQNLYNDVNESFVIVTGHWCVGTHNQITINPGREVNMLALREKEYFTSNS